jgi:cellulose synthase/poly-beta-1,6-N-acetylglucosamine synthase-like glycosyltransferase
VVLLICYQFCSGAGALIQITFSLRKIRHNALGRRTSRFELVDSPKVQPVSIIVWIQDRGYGLTATIKSLLALNYPDYEIIIIDDGSVDETLETLGYEFGLEPLNRVFRRSLPTGPIDAIYSSAKYPILSVVEKPRTGRADSLNIGLNLAKAPIVCILDADHIIARDGLVLLAKPFIEEPTSTLMSTSTGESEAIENGPINFSESLRLIESKRLLHASLIERGVFCSVIGRENAVRMLRKADLIDLGGFSDGALDRDLQINLFLHRSMLKQGRKYRVNFVPDIICWKHLEAELASGSLQSFWQAGALRAVGCNLSILYTSRMTLDLRLAFLHLIFEVLGPIIRLCGLLFAPLAYLTGAISLDLALLYFFAFSVFALLEGLGGIIADELSMRRRHSLAEIMNLILASLIEGLFYRHLTDLRRVWGALRAMLI